MKPYLNEPVVIKITAALFVPAGGGAPVHTDRRSYGLAFNTGHSSTYRFADGTVLTCHSGQCIYLPMGSTYTVDRSEPSDHLGDGVHAVNFLLEKPLFDGPVLLSVRSCAAFLSAFVHSEKAWRQKLPGYRETCFAQLYTLLGILNQERESYMPASRTRRTLAPALAYIDENFTDGSFSLCYLAKLCGVSEPYLRRLFQGIFGMPPARYVRHKRLMYARELLDTGEYGISQAASEAGFNDAAYFSREFKKAFGASPNRYRSGL